MEIWLFIIGYIIQCVGSVMLLVSIRKQKSIFGLSADSLHCFLLSTVSRCFWSLDTRLVETPLLFFELVLSTLAYCSLTYYAHKLRHTNSKQPPMFMRAPWLALGALLAAVAVHPGKYWVSMQVLVAFSIYIEAVALLPQLYFMRRMYEVSE
eukprot:GHVU01067284.1.p1 GENE.GHVU01067284.1~~GHVU01067284.1.p1  ORF type:complete len:152 (-),score=12.30 GHVU01067284.1:1075-1530(-)